MPKYYKKNTNEVSHQIFNLGSGKQHSLKKMINILEKSLKTKSKSLLQPHQEGDEPRGRVARYLLVRQDHTTLALTFVKGGLVPHRPYFWSAFIKLRQAPIFISELRLRV